MGYLTLRELIDRVVERLSMAAGQGVQTYAEDRIAQAIQSKFDMMFFECFWPQFRIWKTSTLDGTLGVVTDDLTEEISRFEDIEVVYPKGSAVPITRLPGSLNPTLITGTRVRFFSPLPVGDTNVAKVFHVWPKTATGQIVWAYRRHPKMDASGRLFTVDDEVSFDEDALITGTCFDILEDDGTNPNATQKFQSMFEARYGLLKKNLNSGSVKLDVAEAGIPSSWTELR